MALYTSELELKIPFYDLDPMNVVWHGNYIKYMEQARCDLFSKLHYTYNDMRDDLYVYPIAKMSTKYIKPVFFEQKIIVKTSLIDIEPAMNIKYEIFDKLSGEKLFKAETMQIAVNIETLNTMYEAPERLKNILESLYED